MEDAMQILAQSEDLVKLKIRKDEDNSGRNKTVDIFLLPEHIKAAIRKFLCQECVSVVRTCNCIEHDQHSEIARSFYF